MNQEINYLKDKVEIDQLIGKGSTAEIFSIKGNKNQVIKLFKDTIENEKIFQEYKKAKCIADITKLAPKIYGIVEIENRYGIVMGKINGNTLSEHLAVNPKEICEVLSVFAKTLTYVHSCEDKNEILPSQKSHYENLINRLEDSDKRNSILEILNELPNGDSICHDDIHLNNTMIIGELSDKSLLENVKMIDWAGCTKGNPLGNFALALVLFMIRGGF